MSNARSDSVFAGLESLNALVVGASSGIGLEFVRQLLADDRIHHLYATHRRPQPTDLFRLAQGQGDRLMLLPMDVCDETQIAQAIRQIQTQIDRLHLVLYCVGWLHQGLLQPEKSLQQVSAEQLLRYFQVNSMGAILLAKQILPLLKHSQRSVFASISAKVGSIGDNRLGGWYGYRASKAALNMLMHTAAIEYARKSPQTLIVLLHPGTTDTELSRPFQANIPAERLFPVDRTVTQLLQVIDQLQPHQSGQFLSWDGAVLPW
jgi:NAD(P)-dependent dehydrogenase (short-subunit alcohol dehydrogenase family)